MSSIKLSQSSGSMASAETSVQDLEPGHRCAGKSGLYAGIQETKKTCSWESLIRRYFDVLMARGHPDERASRLDHNVESFLKVCYGSWGSERGCFSVNSMRGSSQTSPPKARQIMVASGIMKAHQLLIDNLAAARGARDDNEFLLAGLDRHVL